MKNSNRVIAVLSLGEIANATVLRLERSTVCEINCCSICAEESADVDEANRIALATKIVANKGTVILVLLGSKLALTHDFLCRHKGVRKAIRTQGKRICIVWSGSSGSFVDSDWNLSYALASAEHSKPGVYAVVRAQRFSQGTYYLGDDGIIYLK